MRLIVKGQKMLRGHIKSCAIAIPILALQGCVWSGHLARPDGETLYGATPGPVASLQNYDYLNQTCVNSFREERIAKGISEVSNSERTKFEKDVEAYCSCFSNWTIENVTLESNYKFVAAFYETSMTNIRMKYYDVPLRIEQRSLSERFEEYERAHGIDFESFQRNLDKIDNVNAICINK